MATWNFRATHVVPQSGLPAWEAPDVSRPTASLDPLLPVQLAERRGDWGRIVCANGWGAWVDGRLLVPVPQEPPAAGQPLARTADPLPLLARVGETLARYRRAAQALADGVSDGETFRDSTRGLRVGLVVDGESVWLYDAEHERWVYCDGLRLSTFATSSGPSSRPEAARPGGGGAASSHDPTRVAGSPVAGAEASKPDAAHADKAPPDGGAWGPPARHEPTDGAETRLPHYHAGPAGAEETRLLEAARSASDRSDAELPGAVGEATRVWESASHRDEDRHDATRVVDPTHHRDDHRQDATRTTEPTHHREHRQDATRIVRAPDERPGDGGGGGGGR